MRWARAATWSGMSAPPGGPGREELCRVAAHQCAEALVLLAAGRAAVEVRAQPRNRRVDVVARELELPVAVELVEAGVTADLGLRGAEQPVDCLLQIRLLHHSSFPVSNESPRSARCRRSLRRASCSVL